MVLLFSFWGLTLPHVVEIIHTEGFIISAYYSWNKLGAIVILSSDFCAGVALCWLQISQEGCKQSNGERKRLQRGKCMQICGARWVSAAAAVCQGRMWLPALSALTFITCDVIKQKSFGSGAPVHRQSPIIGRSFGFITPWIYKSWYLSFTNNIYQFLLLWNLYYLVLHCRLFS